MVNLWNGIYNYKDIVLHLEAKKIVHSNKKKKRMENVENFGDFLLDICSQINVNKCNDG